MEIKFVIHTYRISEYKNEIRLVSVQLSELVEILEMYYELTEKNLQQNNLQQMEFPSMLSQGASLARTSAPPLMPTVVQALGENEADCSQKLSGLLKSWPQKSSSLRTSQVCLLTDLSPSCKVFARSGMMRSGTLSPLPHWGRPKHGIEYGLLPTLPKSETRDRSKASILARLDKGGRVARRICKTSPLLRSLEQIVGLNPSFAEWMSGFPIGWTELEPAETQRTPQSLK